MIVEYKMAWRRIRKHGSLRRDQCDTKDPVVEIAAELNGGFGISGQEPIPDNRGGQICFLPHAFHDFLVKNPLEVPFSPPCGQKKNVHDEHKDQRKTNQQILFEPPG